MTEVGRKWILNDKDLSVGAVGGDLIEPAKPARIWRKALKTPTLL